MAFPAFGEEKVRAVVCQKSDLRISYIPSTLPTRQETHI